MRTLKKDGGQYATMQFVKNGIRSYKSLYDLMKDSKQYGQLRQELNLPYVTLQDNGVITIKTYHVESWVGTYTRNYYFVFDQFGRLVPNFDAEEVGVDSTNIIVCLVFDPPYNVDNVSIEFCARLDSLYVQPLTRDGSNQYKIRDTAAFYPGRGIPSEYELANMVAKRLGLTESHEFQNIKDLRMTNI